MPASTNGPIRNALIESLPNAEKTRMLARCQMVELVPGANLCNEGEAYEHAWFPLTALISLGSKLPHHAPLDMGPIGSEGMLGATIALGIDTVPMQATVSGGGTALRMSTVELRTALRENDSLWWRIDRYLYIVLVQYARAAACNRFHAIGPRLARCLSIAADRTATDHLRLTHESLAAMLGVRRSGITVAARSLSERGLIRYARGEIVILDRDGLKAAACTCYADWPAIPPI